MKNLEFVNPHNTLSVRKYYWAEKIHLQRMGIHAKPTERCGAVTIDSRSQEAITTYRQLGDQGQYRASVELATKFRFWCKFFSLGMLRHGLLLVHLII